MIKNDICKLISFDLKYEKYHLKNCKKWSCEMILFDLKNEKCHLKSDKKWSYIARFREQILPYFLWTSSWNRSSRYLSMPSNKQLNVVRRRIAFNFWGSRDKWNSLDCTAVNLLKILRSLLIEAFVATTVEYQTSVKVYTVKPPNSGHPK